MTPDTTGVSPQANDSFALEEFKQLRNRIDIHERRYYQMLLSSVTGVVATIGLSEHVPPELIAYVIAPFLFTTVRIAVISRMHQRYNQAYIIEVYDGSIPSMNSETCYHKVFSRHFGSRFIVMRGLQNSFVVVTSLGYAMAGSFAVRQMAAWYESANYLMLVAYSTPLAAFLFLTLRSVWKLRGYTVAKYQSMVRDELNATNAN